MELGRSEIEGIYNGHLSWRRLRGVKINPIYQESDIVRNGDSTDTQSDTSIPVGEIQIEMYESLPRHRLVRPSRSDPNLPFIPPEAIFTAGAVCKEQQFDALGNPVQSSHFSHSRSRNRIKNPENDNQSEDVITLYRSSRNKENTLVEDDEITDQSYRKQLKRQTGIDAMSGDPNINDTAPSPGKTSASSSAIINASSSSNTQPNSTLKRKGTPRFFKSRNFLRKKQLSAVEEDKSIHEVDDVMENCVTESGPPEVNDNEERTTNDCVVDDSDHNSCLNEIVTYNIDDESCHSMNATNKQQNWYNIVSSHDGDADLKENIANKYVSTTDMDLSILSSSEDILQISQKEEAYYLDKIALVPSYSHMHNTSPVSSIDHINNNNETVPDLMLQHNGTLHGVSRFKPINGFNKQQSSAFDGHDYIARETQELEVMYAFSKTSSLDSDKSPGKETHMSGCDCGGRPTLKCACGRKALQSILKEKYVTKYNEGRMHENNDNSLAEDITVANRIETPSKCSSEKTKQTFDSRIYAHFDDDISEITEVPVKESPKKKIEPLKSILHIALSPAKSPSNTDAKKVSFSQDTIFNEDKDVVYLKECISPSDLALLISEIDNDDGLENPAFDDITEDENSADNKKSKKRSKKKNKIASNDSLVLKVTDLNTPAYMQPYLNGVSGCDVVRTPSLSNAKKAPPVSIEAIGGIIVEDVSFDEINVMRDDDDEFEECRRRRKMKYCDDEEVDTWMKKTRRRKKIKICLIVFIVIALLITGIALAIHFGAPHVGSVTGGLSPSQGPSGGLPGFPIL